MIAEWDCSQGLMYGRDFSTSDVCCQCSGMEYTWCRKIGKWSIKWSKFYSHWESPYYQGTDSEYEYEMDPIPVVEPKSVVTPPVCPKPKKSEVIVSLTGEFPRKFSL